VNAGERFLDGARAPDTRSALEDEHALAGSREIRGAGEAVVSGADDDRVPAPRREFADRRRQPNFAEDSGGG